jgi:prepilin-type N-terminal cleavage/methylation domain-containing protein
MRHSQEAAPRVAARRPAGGFTLTETLLTLAVLGIGLGIAAPKVAEMSRHLRVDRAAAVLATDLEAALAIAGRQRKPVRLSCDCAGKRYTVADRAGGAVRLSRALGAGTEFGATSLALSATPVDIFPTGVTSAPLTVTIGAGAYTRRVTMTTAGHVRILPR